MQTVELAYYPGDTPLYEGEASVAEVTDDSEQMVAFARIPGRTDYSLCLYARVERPLRTQYIGYLTRQGGCPEIICNVDAELDPQPSTETVVRAMLAAAMETA